MRCLIALCCMLVGFVFTMVASLAVSLLGCAHHTLPVSIPCGVDVFKAWQRLSIYEEGAAVK